MNKINDSIDIKKEILKLVVDDTVLFKDKMTILEFSLKQGLDLNQPMLGKSLLCWAKETKDDELVKFLEDKGAKETVVSKEKVEQLEKSLFEHPNNVYEVKKLVFEGANIAKTNVFGDSVFNYLNLEQINEVLDILPKGYEIDGNVDLSNYGFRKLPDFSRFKVNGDFICSNMFLTSLKGAPEEVKGKFDCRGNYIMMLKDGPQKVGGDYICSGNQIYSLDGAPDSIKGVFDCSYNVLTSLEKAPKEVLGGFYCTDNRLTTLEGLSTKFGGNVSLENNKLTSLMGMQEKIDGNFVCSGNLLTSLKGGPNEVSGNFDCHGNQLTTLVGGPQKVGGDYDCVYNQLVSLNGAPYKIMGDMWCNNNRLKSLEGGPTEVEGFFVCSKNELTSLKGSPQKVGGNFECRENPLENIDDKPKECVGKFKCDDLEEKFNKKTKSKIDKARDSLSKKQEKIAELKGEPEKVEAEKLSNEEVVKMLIEKGADINKKDDFKPVIKGRDDR